MKAIIFDSGPLINFSMNGLLPMLEKLKGVFNGKFLITSHVAQEVVYRPMQIKKFELGALRIQDLVARKILEYPESLNIKSNKIEDETRRLMSVANCSLKTEGTCIRIVSDAEISCIALALELKKQGVDSIIAIDERTARMLSEKPENLARLMSQKLHRNISFSGAKEFEGIKFMRSPELVYVAYKKGLVGLKDNKALEALLYATKFKGAAISYSEVEQLKRM